MRTPLIDTNIFLRHLRHDNPDHSPRATAFLEKIERGELHARTTDTIVFETVFTLHSFYKQPKAAIRDALLPLIELPGIVLPSKRRYRRAFDLFVRFNVSFADAFHAVIAGQLTAGEIVSFDKGFDRIPSIKRIEP